MLQTCTAVASPSAPYAVTLEAVARAKKRSETFRLKSPVASGDLLSPDNSATSCTSSVVWAAAGGAEGMPELPKSLQFSLLELDSAIRIIHCVTDSLDVDETLLAHPALAPLRRALRTFMKHEAAKVATTRMARTSTPDNKCLRHKLQLDTREHDRDCLERTRLRTGRSQNLAKLRDDPGIAVSGVIPRVPDGIGHDVCDPKVPTEIATEKYLQFSISQIQRRKSDFLGSNVDLTVGTGSGLLHRPRTCYVCKRSFLLLHLYYDSLCGICAAFNYAKRSQTADLSGRVSLVTGARVKVGFQVCTRGYPALMNRVAANILPQCLELREILRFRSRVDYSEARSHLYRVMGVMFSSVEIVLACRLC